MAFKEYLEVSGAFHGVLELHGVLRSNSRGLRWIQGILETFRGFQKVSGALQVVSSALQEFSEAYQGFVGA